MGFIVDYIWYVGEKTHQQWKNPGDGEMLVASSWFCTCFLPWATLLYKISIPFYILLIGFAAIISFPFLFCRLRYGKKTKEALSVKYGKYKNWGKRLFKIWGVLLAVLGLEIFLFVAIGLWHN